MRMPSRKPVLLFLIIILIASACTIKNNIVQPPPGGSSVRQSTPVPAPGLPLSVPQLHTQPGPGGNRSAPLQQSPPPPSVAPVQPEPAQPATPIAADPGLPSEAPPPSEAAAPSPAVDETPAAPAAEQSDATSEQLAQQELQAGSEATADEHLTYGQLARAFPSTYFLSGASSERKAALTFDDAPDETYTAQVLDILRKHKVKATFFVVGWRAEKYPELVLRMAGEGHAIGNHSFDHANLAKLSEEKFRYQIVSTQQTLQALIGYEPSLLRPPYGEMKRSQVEWAEKEGLKVVNWNVDSEDWKQIDEQQVIANVMKDLRGGSIILQHSGGGVGQDLSGTVNALPNLIRKLKDQGYELVTVPELLQVSRGR